MKVTFESIMKEWEEHDCLWDNLNPQEEIRKIPKLHSKYLRWRMTAAFLSVELREKYNVLRAEKSIYYRGLMPAEEWKAKGWEPPNKKLLKNEVDVHLDKDEELVSLKLRKEKQDLITKYCDMVLEELKSRHFDISNCMNWEKFKAGA